MRTREEAREGAGLKLMGAKGKGRRNGSWRSEVDRNAIRDIQRGKGSREGKRGDREEVCARGDCQRSMHPFRSHGTKRGLLPVNLRDCLPNKHFLFVSFLLLSYLQPCETAGLE